MQEHQRQYEQNLAQNLQALNANLSDELLVYLASQENDLVGISTTLLKLERYQQIEYALVLDAKQKVVSQYLNPVFYADANELPNFDLERTLTIGTTRKENSLVDLQLIGDTSLTAGYLILVADLSEQLAQSRNAFVYQLIPLVAISMLAILALSHWLQSGVIRPVIELSRLVTQVSDSQDYRLRYVVKGSDEVATLGKNINHMLETINQKDDQNRYHTEELLKQRETLENLANYDQLTGLPNRKLFSELLKRELDKCKRAEQELAVMFLDLDDFKTVNDSLGHHAGDVLLQQTAKRIKLQLRESDIFARLGGDEFVIVLGDLPSHVTAIGIAMRILDALKQAFKITDFEVHTGLSIGIAFSENDRFDVDALLTNADVAMYKAKDAGRNQYAVFEDQMQEVQQRHMLIANQLNNAIRDKSFELFYQPKVSPTFGVVGLEALIRWPSEFDGYISPAEFIPIAEHSGKVNDITRWVIEQGLKDQHVMRDELKLNLTTSFNISAYDIFRRDFADYIRHQISQQRAVAKLVEFEVTESAYIENYALASGFFNDISDLGCRIALDDFGTGYSSLSYLTQVKASTLKIDQEFVRKMMESRNDRLVVEAIISLARRLNLEVCAEGVETIEEFEFLSKLGCHQIQGYYFSPPRPLAELMDVIEQINKEHNFSGERTNIASFS